MKREEAIEKLKRERNGVCRGCAHPSMVGWCENHCKLPEAYDMAIEALGQPEIIYCHECKHFQCNMRFDGSVPKGADAYECRHWCGICDPMDYCSCGERAERRTDE